MEATFDAWRFIANGRWIRIASIFDEKWHEGSLTDPEVCIRALTDRRINGVRPDLLTFAQTLSDTTPRYPYHLEWDSIAAIPLTTWDAWWTGSISTHARRDVKIAERRGVVARLTECDAALVGGIVQINNESPVRQGRPFSHYQDSFAVVERAQRTYADRSWFIGAYIDEELIGFVKIVRVGRVAHMMQMLAKSSHSDKRPGNLLIARAVEHCIAMGMSYLTYGKYAYGKKRTSSLTSFKDRNGFEEIRVPRFYVPLTAKGRIGLTLGLHRDLVGIIPEGLGRRLRDLRRLWTTVTTSKASSLAAGKH